MREEIQMEREARGRFVARKLSSLKKNHRQFVTRGKGIKAKAQQFFNSIHSPIWEIPVRQVCPPYLHILLGIVKRHHDLLEDECYQIDKFIAVDIARSNVALTKSKFDLYVQSWRAIYNLKHERQQAVRELETAHDITPLAHLVNWEVTLTSKIVQLDKHIERKKSAIVSLDKLSGPVTANLEKVLQQHNIKIQAYHSRSFVGNHCVKYLKDKVITDLCQGIVDKASELSGNKRTTDMAKHTASKFRKLNELYSKAHDAVAHALPVAPDHVGDIQERVDEYLAYYRVCFPGKIIPKQHFLEDHVPPWINRWQVGMALHGEQGGESVHAEFNILQRAACGVRRELDQLVVMMRDHHTRCSPTLHQYVIMPKGMK